MQRKSEVNSPRPWLAPHEHLDAEKARELITLVRRMGGEELLVRTFDTSAPAGPAATRLRRVLGTDFYVMRRDNEIWVRARKAGEPELSRRRIRTGTDWMTVVQAAERLSMTQQWFRAQFLAKGVIPKYRFGTRVVVKRADVEALAQDHAPGGAFVGRRGGRHE